MNRHIHTEQLSAYLDSELGVAESRELEIHLRECAECGANLASMRRVLSGLAQVERSAPPPELAQSIRRQTRTQSPRRVEVSLHSWRSFFLLPIQPTLRTSFAVGLTFVMSVFLVGHGVEQEHLRKAGVDLDGLAHDLVKAAVPQESVKVYFGDETPLFWPETTSEVAGREFILNDKVLDDKVWVQRGLEGKKPSAHVDARSPEGRRLLTKYSDLGYLLAEGRVVLRYNTETVELRNDRGRLLGYEAGPLPRRNDPRVFET
jgi:hypothetical protein